MEKDMEKYSKDLERYELIVNYFKENPDRAKSNAMCFDDLKDTLKKVYSQKIDPSDENIQKKVSNYVMAKGLYEEVVSILVDALFGKLEKISESKIKAGVIKL
jgi:hypothetical protein